MAENQNTINRSHLSGEQNPNWKGGRSVASNGYVLVRVGTGHRLADVRGYAYEHRVVAEAKLGRPLAPGEQVHHIDGDKQNNHPLNLLVTKDQAHHALIERRAESRLKHPEEANPEIPCACGCGKRFMKYDSAGRPRKFISGHNPQRINPTNGRFMAYGR